MNEQFKNPEQMSPTQESYRDFVRYADLLTEREPSQKSKEGRRAEYTLPGGEAVLVDYFPPTQEKASSVERDDLTAFMRISKIEGTKQHVITLGALSNGSMQFFKRERDLDQLKKELSKITGLQKPENKEALERFNAKSDERIRRHILDIEEAEKMGFYNATEANVVEMNLLLKSLIESRGK